MVKDSYLILCVYQYSLYYTLERVNFVMYQLYLNKVDLTKTLWQPSVVFGMKFDLLLQFIRLCFSTVSPTPFLSTSSDPHGQDFLLSWGNAKLVRFSRHCTCSFSRPEMPFFVIIPCQNYQLLKISMLRYWLQKFCFKQHTSMLVDSMKIWLFQMTIKFLI